MGKRNGRGCLLHQIDFEDIFLIYQVNSKSGRLGGEVKSIEEFYQTLTDICELLKTDRVELALRYFRTSDNSTSGICIRSFPPTQLTALLLSTIRLCCGGYETTDLSVLPYSGGLLDQPNLFIEALSAYISERSKFSAEQRKKQKDEADRQQRRNLGQSSSQM